LPDEAKSIDERIRGLLAEILEVDVSRIGDGFGPQDAELWDSLNALKIVSVIEETFEIRFSMAEIGEMIDFARIREAVHRHLESPAAG